MSLSLHCITCRAHTTFGRVYGSWGEKEREKEREREISHQIRTGLTHTQPDQKKRRRRRRRKNGAPLSLLRLTFRLSYLCVRIVGSVCTWKKSAENGGGIVDEQTKNLVLNERTRQECYLCIKKRSFTMLYVRYDDVCANKWERFPSSSFSFL